LEVEGGRKRVWSFVKSKKGATHQTRQVSDVDETLQFWRQQFHDDEPLTEGDHTLNAEPVVYTEGEISMVLREMADRRQGRTESGCSCSRRSTLLHSDASLHVSSP